MRNCHHRGTSVIERVRIIELLEKGDDRGHLVVIEGNQNIPFHIMRSFYIYGSEHDVVRGCHANRQTEFVLINVSGQSKVKVKDGRGNEIVYCLDRPHTGIYLPQMVWKEMYDFSDDSILLVFASEHYNEKEYIRDYSDYERMMQEV